MDIEKRSRSRDSSSRPDRDSRFPECPPSNKLYLTFLPQDIDEGTLRDSFQAHGTVTRLKIIKKDDGFTLAFLDMESVEEAERAVHKMNRFRIGDKSIRVQFAREKKQEGGGDRDRDNSRERGGGGFRGDFKKEADTRRRFDGEQRGRGRGGRGGRGGRESDFGGDRRGGDQRGFRDNERGGRSDGGERRSINCHKCSGEGHIARNCPDQNQGPPPRQNNDRGNDRSRQKPEKMSQDQFCDY